MAKQKIKDKVSLERIIDEFLKNDIPLSILTDKYDLTYSQIQLLLNRTRGFSRQTDKIADILGDYNIDEYSDNYLAIPHDILEKNPLKNEEQIALFRRLDELKNLLSLNVGRLNNSVDIASLEARIASYDKGQIKKIESFLQELSNLEDRSIDNISFIMRRYGMTSTVVQDFSLVYNQYLKDCEELERLKQEKIENETTQKQVRAYEREYQSIRDELVVRNMKLVNWCIRNFFNNIPLPKDEAQLYGVEGLARAINGFDCSLGYQFSTYAVVVIERNIKKYFKELYGMTWEDFTAKELIRYYRSLAREYDSERVVDATPHELAGMDFVNLSSKQISNYDAMLDAVIPNADIYGLMESDLVPTCKNEMPISFADYEAIDEYEDMISAVGSDNTEEEIDLSFCADKIRKVLGTLTADEEKVLILRYGLDDNRERTLEEIRKILNVSKGRVRDIEIKALKKLRNPYRSRHIRGFF